MLSDKFIELLTKKLSGEIDIEEAEEFNDFLNNSEECKAQYALMKTYWTQDTEQYSDSSLMFDRIKSRIDTPKKKVDLVIEDAEPKKTFTLWRSIAATIVLGVCTLLIYQVVKTLDKEQTPALELTHTPSRYKTKIVLSDGTKVMLNSETDFRYPLAFNNKTREVYLNGEAFFDVAKDHKHPFIVHTGKMTVKVLGTKFNVKSYNNDATSETTLIKGAVEVTLADRPSDRIILKPHDKLILSNNFYKHERSQNHSAILAAQKKPHTNYTLTDFTYFKTNDSTIVETSWVNDKLLFKDESFIELANQLERWYGVKFKFKNDSIKSYHFTGVFEKENIAEALGALQLTEQFKYKIHNLTVYVY